MTRERIKDFKEIVLPFFTNYLLKENYENLGKSDAEEFEKDFKEIIELADKALEQEPCEDGKWIPVSKLMPEEHDSIFAKYIGTDKWSRYMFAKISDPVLVTRLYPNGSKLVRVSHTIDGGQWTSKLRLDDKSTVVAWMPLPEPWK